MGFHCNRPNVNNPDLHQLKKIHKLTHTHFFLLLKVPFKGVAQPWIRAFNQASMHVTEDSVYTHSQRGGHDLPSSPPTMEKSCWRMYHFWTRWALEVALSLTRLMPSWMAAFTARSRPPARSETRVALLPSFLQISTASGVSSSSGAPSPLTSH